MVELPCENLSTDHLQLCFYQIEINTCNMKYKYVQCVPDQFIDCMWINILIIFCYSGTFLLSGLEARSGVR